jgi:1-acyl-sn-glycerol-3-phosphate acyltransferase
MLYWGLKVILTPLLRVFYRVHVDGRANVPTSGPVILAANHRSFMDSLFIPLVLRRRITFVAKAEYFESKKTAWFFRAVGQIPIKREGGTKCEDALATATEVLADGRMFAIYPEGTRTRDGFTHRGHTGAARIALRTSAPIVPIGLIGTDECQPVDRKLPKLFCRIEVRFGAPIDASRYAADAEGLALRQLTDEVMYEIVELCGRYEYHDTYATKRAEDVPIETAHVEPFHPQAARVA